MTIAWFSCSATFAVACKIALACTMRYNYMDTGFGHPDSIRFWPIANAGMANRYRLSEAISIVVWPIYIGKTGLIVCMVQLVVGIKNMN